MGHWTLDDIPWRRFDPDKVDPDIVRIVKAASLVEQNGADYAHYLCNVFADDPGFQTVVRRWGAEETQHGQALGRWATLADPRFDHAAACARFSAGFRVPLEAKASVRGSRAGELVARCIVETGTSSYYTALGEAVAEPVLRDICHRIAADELRHYKLFYTHLSAISNARGWGCGAGRGWRSAASPKPRTTSWPSPITSRTSPTAPMTAIRRSKPMRGVPMRWCGRITSSAAPP